MLDRTNSLPLYIQFKNEIIEKIKSGEYKPGNPVPTEEELCKEYGVSRYPVRQAMDELVAAGYITRTRGRGTFVCQQPPCVMLSGRKKVLGLVMGNLTEGLCGQILNGFEKQAREKGYLTITCSSEGISDKELNCIDKLIESNASGISIFPCDDSRIGEKYDELAAKGIYLGLLDRNPGLSNIDYTGSDNIGGAYTAVRHLAFQGYMNVAFVSDGSNASSVNERLEGYLMAVRDFCMNSVTHINIKEDISRFPHFAYRFFLGQLKEELMELKKQMPLGIFAINDSVALQCMRILKSESICVGRDMGIVGFDNTVECEYAPTPLTSVAQNGFLIGQSAADIAINKIEGRTSAVFRSVIPTQLVVRNSCGEKV